MAYTNPIYGDIDGRGYRANGNVLGPPLLTGGVTTESRSTVETRTNSDRLDSIWDLIPQTIRLVFVGTLGIL